MPINEEELVAAVRAADPAGDVGDIPAARPTSGVAHLLALKVGETYARSERVPSDITLGEMADRMHEMRRALRQSVMQSIRHAQKHGRSFSMETATSMTTSNKMHVVVIVTRTE